jgi:hypothetical protein
MIYYQSMKFISTLLFVSLIVSASSLNLKKNKSLQTTELGDELFVNGNLAEPNLQGGVSHLQRIPGWVAKVGVIELGFGKVYNERWNNQVIEIDGNENDTVSQIVNFKDAQKCKLSIQYAARDGLIHTSGVRLSWNSNIIADIIPTNYEINTFTADVDSIIGENSFDLIGSLASDGLGLTLSNASLRCFPKLEEC